MKEPVVSASRQEFRKKHRARRIGRRTAVILTLLLPMLFLSAPFLARYRARVVMGIYDAVMDRGSVPTQIGLNVVFPLRDSGFFPLLVTFSADEGMSQWLDQEVQFTVDYTVADIPHFKSSSLFYQEGHPLYGAYIGTYFLRGLAKDPLADESWARDLAAGTAAFDQRVLALPALGLSFADNTFETGEPEVSRGHEIAGLNWMRFDADVTTNGPEHRAKRFLPAYFHFGWPPQTEAEYPLRQMKGRFYLTYVPEEDLIMGLYMLLADQETLEQADQEIIRQAEISWTD